MSDNNPTTSDLFDVYVSTEKVRATPMSWSVYSDLCAWTMAEDEQDDEGYLVEFSNEGPANVTGLEGYVTWYSKEEFEGSYQAVGADASVSEQAAKPHGEGTTSVENFDDMA